MVPRCTACSSAEGAEACRSWVRDKCVSCVAACSSACSVAVMDGTALQQQRTLASDAKLGWLTSSGHMAKVKRNAIILKVKRNAIILTKVSEIFQLRYVVLALQVTAPPSCGQPVGTHSSEVLITAKIG